MAYGFGSRIDDDSYALTIVDEDQGTAVTKGEINGVPFESGGGGGFLDVTETAGVLDKTWTEIFTALSDGEMPRIISNGADFAAIKFLNIASYDGEFYFVYILGEPTVWYQTSTANGYPEFTED